MEGPLFLQHTGNRGSASKATGPHVQEAGKKLEDPNWRLRPASLPRFGAARHASSNGPVTPQQSPVIQRGASSSPATNGHATPRFRFGVPSMEYLSFAGPGGNDFAAGESSARFTGKTAWCLRAPHSFCADASGAQAGESSWICRAPACHCGVVCSSAQLHWSAGYKQLFKEACDRLHDQGGVPVVIDFSSFAKTAGMLYTSAFLAERYAGIRPFLESKVSHQPPLLCPCAQT